MTNDERQLLLDSGVSMDFISLDTWFLTHLRRGILDVPPRAWGIADCDGDVLCRNVKFLFNNMPRIGVDLPANGNGIVIYDEAQGGYTGNYASQWFLPEEDHQYSQLDIWARNQAYGGNPGDFACGTNHLGNSWIPDGGYQGDQEADVCWVCQDLSTQLYLQMGYDLQNAMINSTWYKPDRWSNPAAISRQVGAVRQFLKYGLGRTPKAGNDPSYTAGEMVFLFDPTIDHENYNNPYHSGIVVRGVAGPVNLSDALDTVYIAQVSFSSQGFYESNSSGSFFTPTNTKGKFEVITLRAYFYKALLSEIAYLWDNGYLPQGSYNLESLAPEAIPILAGIFMEHGSPR